MLVRGNHISSIMWSRWLVTILVLLVYQIVLINIKTASAGRSQNFKISPKPCFVGGIEGTCMFVWECIKSEGQHVGMCVDSFMFGSCCSHNLTDNVIIQQTFSYTRPTRPPTADGRPRPPPPPYRPMISGMTTIERPNGASTLVIRPSGPVHQRPSISVSSTTMKQPSPSNAFNDLDTAASVAGSVWNTSPQTTQWHMTTEPNFITRPRPPVWEKPTSLRPKPPKPTKKPVETTQSSSPFSDTTRRPTVTRPRPQVSHHYKPTRPVVDIQQSSTPSTTTRHTTTTTTRRTTTTTTTTTRRPTTTTTTTTTSTTTTRRPTTTASTTTTTTTTTSAPPSSSPSVFSSTPGGHLSLQPAASNNYDQNVKNISRVTISAAKSLECGTPTMTQRPETRIVGGKNAPFGRWPWQVSVRRTSFFGFSSTHRCGGALINENWIATAGHCVDDLLTSQIRIRVGEYDFSHVQEQLPYIERAVAKKVVHPKYNFFTYEYDLALVKLEQPLEFAPHVSPVCLPGSDDLLIGMNATVTGWGRLSEGGTLPSVLQEVSVPIVSNDRCKSMFLRAGRHEYIPDIFLCAGYETGGQDSCQGDSGGPLQVKASDGRYFLAGIISWGIGCAEANLPGVCTRISKFVPWILETVT